MKACYSLLLFLFVSFGVCAAPGDTTTIVAHNNVDMTWNGNYNHTASLPYAGISYRKIIMHYDMGCATGGCSDWDYTTQVFVMQPTGIMDSSIARVDTLAGSVYDTIWSVFEVNNSIELGRVITPYANGKSMSWSRRHSFDVTDFASLLEGDTDLRIKYHGWSSGFSATITFEFIEGTPPRPVLSIDGLYIGKKTYQNSSDFESTFFMPKSVVLPSGIVSASIYSTITGHGFDNDVNCAEFCVKDYSVKVNGANVATRTIWNDECGLNPDYPQPGTWLIDRAGWCPGNKADIHHIDITSALNGSTSTPNDIDFDMDVYSWSGAQAPFYVVNSFLVTYGAIANSNDISVIDIIAPTMDFEHSRRNPICGSPIIKVKNLGSNTVSTLKIDYGVAGALPCTYTWSGSLDFNDEMEIELPTLNWLNADLANPEFFVTVSEVNGAADNYISDNSRRASYELPYLFGPDSLNIVVTTNNYGNQTGYTLSDYNGNVLLNKATGSLSSNTTYSDAIKFAPGCYILTVNDSNKDGLDFWANNAGSGSIRFEMASLGLTIKSLQNDFGTSSVFVFRIGDIDNVVGSCTSLSNESINVNSTQLQVYPNPSSGWFTMDLNWYKQEDVVVRVVDVLGQIVYEESFNSFTSDKIQLDLSKQTAGIYMVHVGSKTQKLNRKILIVK